MLKSLSGKGECVMAVNNKDAKATFMEALDGLNKILVKVLKNTD